MILEKLCKKCGKTKPSEFFRKDKAMTLGLCSYCKTCMDETRKEWNLANPEKKAASDKAYRESHKERKAATNKAWFESNPGRRSEIGRAWNDANRERIAATGLAYRKANPEKIRASIKAWEIANPDRVQAKSKKWRDANKDKVNEKTTRRRFAKLSATPSWANRSTIADFYAEAQKLTTSTGIEHHVDHFVPLRSKFVCGLHCEANLQVISSSENQSKGNRHWPDMP